MIKYDKKLFVGEVKPNWCPGCGDYSLLSATTKALSKLGYKKEEVVIVSGIGCSSSFPHWTTAYGMHVVHGRALPTAIGLHLSNPNLKVIVVGGDGDGYGIGVGHFVHAARRNPDITYLVMNNQIYGLTLGQASPSSQVGHVTLTTPDGVNENPINPITLALGSGASFVARGFSGNNSQLQSIIEAALNHKGFSFVDTISPCVTFNKLNTFDWFRERMYDLQEKSHNYNSVTEAFNRGVEWGDKIPTGIFYKNNIPTLSDMDPVAKDIVPVNSPIGFNANGITEDEVFDEFR